MTNVQLYKYGNKYNASYELQTNEENVYAKAKVYIESDLINFKYIIGLLGEGYATDENEQRIDINFGLKMVWTNSLLNN